jgi:hypothetical protein
MRIVERFLYMLRGPASDRVVIDQDAALRASERRNEAAKIYIRAVDLERRRAAMLVGAWARETLTLRRRAPMSPKMRAPVLEWLPGLVVSEIVILSKAHRDDVLAHLFGGERIEGVRAVRPLIPTALMFPPPVAPAVDVRERWGGGGGPRKASGGPK